MKCLWESGTKIGISYKTVHLPRIGNVLQNQLLNTLHFRGSGMKTESSTHKYFTESGTKWQNRL